MVLGWGMELSDREKVIIESAAKHEWRYYLPRHGRRRSPSYEKTETDLNYEACDSLVYKGLADRLDATGPGIRVNPHAMEISEHPGSSPP